MWRCLLNKSPVLEGEVGRVCTSWHTHDEIAVTQEEPAQPSGWSKCHSMCGLFYSENYHIFVDSTKNDKNVKDAVLRKALIR